MKTIYYLTKEEIVKEVIAVKEKYDVIAWRVENFTTVKEIVDTLNQIRILLGQQTFLFGCDKENVDNLVFMELMKVAINQKLCDMVEVEMFRGEEVIETIKKLIGVNGLQMMLSVYAGENIPTASQIQIRYSAMKRLGADVIYQSFKVTKRQEYLNIWMAITNYLDSLTKTALIVDIRGTDDFFVEMGSIYLGSDYLVVDQDFICKEKDKDRVVGIQKFLEEIK